ncbi:hypothetical protein V2J09_018805, partial [Rumex salicifolius]
LGRISVPRIGLATSTIPAVVVPPIPSSTAPLHQDEEVEAEKERARRNRLYHLNRVGANSRCEAAILKSSVDIQPEWNTLDQIPFSTFSELSFSVSEPEDLLFCRGVEYYDCSFERFKNRNFFKVATTDDPVIRCLAD